MAVEDGQEGERFWAGFEKEAGMLLPEPPVALVAEAERPAWLEEVVAEPEVLAEVQAEVWWVVVVVVAPAVQLVVLPNHLRQTGCQKPLPRRRHLTRMLHGELRRQNRRKRQQK